MANTLTALTHSKPQTFKALRTADATPQPKAPEGQVDGFQKSETPPSNGMKEAFVKIGKAVTTGGLLGFGTALAVAGAASIAPVAGAITAGALIVAGGVQGAITYGDSGTQMMGNKTAGKLLGATLGAGMTALCAGLGPVGSVVGQSLKGFGMGALFGLIQIGAQNKPG